MKKNQVFLISALFLLLGTVIGFLLSPVKFGINIGNNSGNKTVGADDEEEGLGI